MAPTVASPKHLQALEAHVCSKANDPAFIHHKWFVQHHLKIIEQLVNELCDLYPAARRDCVMAMVWLHDYGKILTNKQLSRDDENNVTYNEGRRVMADIGFPADYIDKVVADLRTFEQHKARDLSKENIEVQIASTADGCAHLVGPFFALHWYENASQTVEALVKENIRKATKDWQNKIILPEARQAFEPRLKLLLEFDPVNRGTFIKK